MNLQKVLQNLSENHIPFVIVGGLALTIYGSNRLTFDSDIAIKTIEIDNVIHVLLASGLKMVIGVDENSYPILTSDISEAIHFSEKSKWGFLKFIESGFELDVLYELPIPFQKLFQEAIKTDFSGIEVRVASLEHIKLMKESSLSNRDDEKREIDLFDLKFIEKKLRERM